MASAMHTYGGKALCTFRGHTLVRLLHTKARRVESIEEYVLVPEAVSGKVLDKGLGLAQLIWHDTGSDLWLDVMLEPRYEDGIARGVSGGVKLSPPSILLAEGGLYMYTNATAFSLPDLTVTVQVFLHFEAAAGRCSHQVDTDY
ncbi:hypothetical protein KC344_g78 [Hortaea werneckii]|nr:hypothetical protein KC344_g78 [Hortaea werneckii]